MSVSRQDLNDQFIQAMTAPIRDLNAIEDLLKRGAEAHTYCTGSQFAWPLEEALNQKNIDLIKLLVKYQDPSLKNRQNLTSIEMVVKNISPDNHVEEEMLDYLLTNTQLFDRMPLEELNKLFMPLLIATKSNEQLRIKLIEKLLSLNVDPNQSYERRSALDPCNHSPLGYLATLKDGAKAIKILLESGANPNLAYIFKSNLKFLSPIERAAFDNKWDNVLMFIQCAKQPIDSRILDEVSKNAARIHGETRRNQILNALAAKVSAQSALKEPQAAIQEGDRLQEETKGASEVNSSAEESLEVGVLQPPVVKQEEIRQPESQAKLEKREEKQAEISDLEKAELEKGRPVEPKNAAVYSSVSPGANSLAAEPLEVLQSPVVKQEQIRQPESQAKLEKREEKPAENPDLEKAELEKGGPVESKNAAVSSSVSPGANSPAAEPLEVLQSPVVKQEQIRQPESQAKLEKREEKPAEISDLEKADFAKARPVPVERKNAAVSSGVSLRALNIFIEETQKNAAVSSGVSLHALKIFIEEKQFIADFKIINENYFQDKFLSQKDFGRSGSIEEGLKAIEEQIKAHPNGPVAIAAKLAKKYPGKCNAENDDFLVDLRLEKFKHERLWVGYRFWKWGKNTVVHQGQDSRLTFYRSTTFEKYVEALTPEEKHKIADEMRQAAADEKNQSRSAQMVRGLQHKF